MCRCDNNSFTTENGTRDIPDWWLDGDKEFEEYFVTDTKDLKPLKSYCEVWLIPERIVGFWVKKDPKILDEDDIQEFIKLVGNVEYI